MNFYIGNSIEEVDINDKNVEVSDELLDFIYKVDKRVANGMSILYAIDPYSDEVVYKDDVHKIVQICDYILESSLLREYKEEQEAIEMLEDLLEMAKDALAIESGLVSIGD